MMNAIHILSMVVFVYQNSIIQYPNDLNNSRFDSLQSELRLAQNFTDQIILLDELSTILGSSDSVVYQLNIEGIELLAKGAEDAERVLNICAELADAYSRVGDVERAIQLYKLALEHSQDRLSIAHGQLLQKIGEEFSTKRDFDSAHFYFGKALEIYETNNFISADIYLALTKANTSARGDLNLSIDYLKTAIDLCLNDKSYSKLGISYYQMAVVFYRLQLYESPDFTATDSTIFYLRKAQKIYDDGKAVDLQNSAKIKRLLGYIQINKGEYVAAMRNLNEAIKTLSKLSDNHGLLEAYYYMTQLYIKQGKDQNATVWAIRSLKLAEDVGLLHLQRPALGSLYEISLAQEDYKMALEYYQKQIEIKDSIFSEESKQRAQELAVSYKTRIKEIENNQLKESMKFQEELLGKQRVIMVGSFIIMGTLACFFLLARYALRKNKIQNRLLRKTKQKVEEQREKLIKLDQTKSRFFNNISHDIKSPLTLILGAFNKIIENDYNLLEKSSQRLVDDGIRNVNRLLFLTNELLDLVKLENDSLKLQIKPVKFYHFMEMLVRIFREPASLKNITINLDMNIEKEFVLLLDPHQFERICYNLLSNAIKFTPHNGEITVIVNQLKTDIQILFSDSGHGIPQEDIKHVFDRYYQASEEGLYPVEGTGIGLAITKELVELHGGAISVESTEHGSEFTVLLPLRDFLESGFEISLDESSYSQIYSTLWIDLYNSDNQWKAASLTNQDPEAKAVLIVEDHKDLRNYLTSILSADYRVCLATNGTAALKVLEMEKIDIILTDLKMPEINGYDLIKLLRDSPATRTIPIVVLTASIKNEEKIDLLNQGVSDIIFKPFDNSELRARIRNILGREMEPFLPSNRHVGSVSEVEKEVISKLERFIIKHIDNPNLSVYDLANEIAASERSAYRQIKKISGMTPYELIQEIRWQYLEKYLQEHVIDSVAQAARIIGMNSSSYFKTRYEERFGNPIDAILGEKE